MIEVELLRDRVDDVIAAMEQQFAGIGPSLEDLIDDALRGNQRAYSELQRIGRQFVAPLIDRYGVAAGTLAAEWYDLNRDLLKVGGDWSGAVVQDPNIDTGPLIGGAVKDYASVQTVVSGIFAGAEQRVRQAAIGSIMDSALRDRESLGWGRVAAVGCCEFCAMLASRGAVYRTRFTATFCPHLHCRCQALPLWKADPTGESMRSRENTIATRRELTDKQRARQNRQARQWIAENRSRLGLVSS